MGFLPRRSKAMFAPLHQISLQGSTLRHRSRRKRSPCSTGSDPGSQRTARDDQSCTTRNPSMYLVPGTCWRCCTHLRVQPGVRVGKTSIAVRNALPGAVLSGSRTSSPEQPFNVSRRVQIRDGVVSNWAGQSRHSLCKTRQPRSYIAHEDGHIRSVPRDQQQAAQLRPPRRPERRLPEVGRKRGHRQRGSLAVPSWGDVDPGDDRGRTACFLTSDTAGYLVRASSLYAITLPTHTETLVKALSGNTAMSYVMHAGEVTARMQRRHCGWWDQPPSHSATYACGNQGFPQRRAACRKAPIRYPRATGTAPQEKKAGFLPPPASRWRAWADCRDAAGDDHRATHVNVYLSERTAAFPICWRPWPWARRPTRRLRWPRAGRLPPV